MEFVAIATGARAAAPVTVIATRHSESTCENQFDKRISTRMTLSTNVDSQTIRMDGTHLNKFVGQANGPCRDLFLVVLRRVSLHLAE